ncbi:copper resistance CopC/CopD family protein [Paenibacillus cymbidii]|uniref:copper resistance CopC/CopD family protein n=1 Tax=Paenibacillus cymbidii TaxID=1639034 RepID=UPI0014369E93|nr:copper resistance protein CopC [Paenibacillus cymbidii]
MRTRWPLTALLLVAFLLCLAPGSAMAHASLVGTAPAADSRLETAPDAVTLTFDERIESKLFDVRVLDQKGKKLNDRQTAISSDGKQLTLPLPDAGNGVYTVNYRIVSADGHPISGAYVYAVGQPVPSSENALPAASGPQSQLTLAWPMGFLDALTFMARFAFYGTMLALAGWVLWTRLHPLPGETYALRQNAWTLGLKRAFVLSLLTSVALQMRLYIAELTGEHVRELMLNTTVGIGWTASIALALLAFYVLERSKAIDLLWVALLLAAKAWTGHAAGLGGEPTAIALDYVHLAAAALWIGGLLQLLVFRRDADWLAQRLPRFSFAALCSIVVLTITGVFLTFAITSDWEELFVTQWGVVLLLKAALVVLVAAVAGGIRLALKRRAPGAANRLLAVDFGSMAAIVALASVLTFLNPHPANKPLNWHVMGETIHMSAVIAPNVPGTNTFTVRVWLPEQAKAPKRTELLLTRLNGGGDAAIEVPLATAELNEMEKSLYAGFTMYEYRAQGEQLALPGKWQVQVRVMDANDDETVYEKTTRIYGTLSGK